VRRRDFGFCFGAGFGADVMRSGSGALSMPSLLPEQLNKRDSAKASERMEEQARRRV
jgi:hypothetical protein